MGGCISSEKPKPAKQYVLKNYKAAPLYEEQSRLPDFGVEDIYEVEEMLGEGGTGQTWLCRDRETDKRIAIKFLQRPVPKVLIPLVTQEIQIQAAVADGHVNLVKIESAVLTKSHLGIVMEYIKGGNLTAYVSSRGSSLDDRNGLFLTEDEARYFFKQFVGAVEHLHHSHIAHRDLKLDNVVLTRDYPPIIKVCDFGFAKDWDETSNMMTSIGTPVYMSPQQLSNSRPENAKAYDATASDVWACGVLLFVMMLGLFPYDHLDNPDPNSSQAHAEVWLQQIKCSWRENERVAGHASKLSPEVVDLLDRIFELDESKRISVTGIKMHPWFNLPLPQHFQASIDNLEARQRIIEMQLKGHSDKIKIRDDNVEYLVREAGSLPTSSSPAFGEGFNVKWVVLSALERQRSLQHSPVYVGSRRGGTFHKSPLPLSPSNLSISNLASPESPSASASALDISHSCRPITVDLVSNASTEEGAGVGSRPARSGDGIIAAAAAAASTAEEKGSKSVSAEANAVKEEGRLKNGGGGEEEDASAKLKNVSKRTLLELNGNYKNQADDDVSKGANDSVAAAVNGTASSAEKEAEKEEVRSIASVSLESPFDAPRDVKTGDKPTIVLTATTTATATAEVSAAEEEIPTISEQAVVCSV